MIRAVLLSTAAAVLAATPVLAQDAAAARRVDALIRDAARTGTTALVVSHDRGSLAAIAARGAVRAARAPPPLRCLASLSR